MTKQKTLQQAFTIEGKGLHTGLDIKATFLPAPENFGYKFKRVDLAGEPVVEALAENVTETARGTVLEKNGAKISTIEHAMATLFAYEIDNCLIEINAPEMPILDGSAHFYADSIEKAGVKEQAAAKDYYIVRKKIEYKNEATGSSIMILPDDDFSIHTLISFDSPVLSSQYATLDKLSDFKTEIASCRTFVFVKEIEPLLKNNLIKGGTLDNAIVIYDQKLPQSEIDRLANLMNQPTQDAGILGYLNAKPLQFNNEPARHKLLDVIGDLALIGKPIKGKIIATKPGHLLNSQLSKIIRKEIRRTEMPTPVYNPNVEPVFDTNKIKSLLPHRYPFLLVDKIIELTDKIVVGVKNVTTNEPFFVGHFPEEPVMPGVLILEAMAQTGGMLVLKSVKDPSRYSTYFMKIDKAKFRHKVVPGDTLIFRIELISEIRRGCAEIKGYAFVGDKIVAEAEFMAQIIKNK